MSTRAIIALPCKEGYETCWNWNDGGPDNLGRELRRYFRSLEEVRSLLQTKSFSIICGPNTINDYLQNGDTAVVLPNLRYLLVHPYQGGVVAGRGKRAIFKSIQEMLDQDINYVYVFDPETNKWTTYK